MEKYILAVMGGVNGLGNKSIERLVKFFGSAKEAWFADESEFVKSGVRKNRIEALISFRNENPDAPEKLVSHCDKRKINLCSICDEDYPPLLKEIDNPPLFFYYRGKLESMARRIAIVGSRNHTLCSQYIAQEWGEEFASAGLTVVSGAARGIDTFAHNGAMKTGRTIAVLGCGIDIAFRSGKKNFFEEIAESGVVLSEFPPQLQPNKNTFPMRNRIIVGLCEGVAVVEAGIRSGSIMTGNLALKNNRKVFAVPRSEGCNVLIRRGAIPVETACDVLKKIALMKGGE